MEKTEEIHIFKNHTVVFQKKSILVVDDNSDMRKLQKDILEMNGFEVFTAQSGMEAFKILGEIDAPKLILLDVKMENMSGPELLIMLEEKKPEIVNVVPIVFLTGMGKFALGKASGFIQKPFDLNKYLEAVHRFIALGRDSSLCQ